MTEPADDLHVLHYVSVDGIEFAQCSCGLVVEMFGGGPASCPVGDAEADYRTVLFQAGEERDRIVARWRAVSAIAEKGLRVALATERR